MNNESIDIGRLYRIRELAEICGVHYRTALRRVQLGKIDSVKIGRNYLIIGERIQDRLNQKFMLCIDRFPFITSVALNLTMFDARKTVQKALPKFLDRPSPFTTKAVQVQKSSKKKLISAVGFASKTFGKLPAGTGISPAEYMVRLIKGGTWKSFNKYIAVPATKRDLNKYSLDQILGTIHLHSSIYFL